MGVDASVGSGAGSPASPPPTPSPAGPSRRIIASRRYASASGRRARGAVQRVADASGQQPMQQAAAPMAWDKLTAEDIESWDDESGPFTPLLDSVNYPVHMKNFNIQQLQQLCKELRADVVHNVSKTGGHLSSSLGVVELTVALHYVFNAPEDKMIWDVGHQCYIHKMLTGRRKQMKSIRQTDGLSGARPPALDSGGGGGGPNATRPLHPMAQALLPGTPHAMRQPAAEHSVL